MIGYVSLDEAKEFLKNRYEEVSEQELIFPRINEKKVHDEIKKAQMLEAYSIVKDVDDDNINDIEKGIASKSIGDMSISYNSNVSNSIGSIIFANGQAKNILYKYVRKTYDWS